MVNFVINVYAGVSVCRNVGYDISQAQSRYLWKKGPPKWESLPTRFFSGKFRDENRDAVAGVAVIVIHICDKLKLSVTQASTNYAQAFKTSLHVTSVDNVILPIHHVRFVKHQQARIL